MENDIKDKIINNIRDSSLKLVDTSLELRRISRCVDHYMHDSMEVTFKTGNKTKHTVSIPTPMLTPMLYTVINILEHTSYTINKATWNLESN